MRFCHISPKEPSDQRSLFLCLGNFVPLRALLVADRDDNVCVWHIYRALTSRWSLCCRHSLVSASPRWMSLLNLGWETERALLTDGIMASKVESDHLLSGFVTEPWRASLTGEPPDFEVCSSANTRSEAPQLRLHLPHRAAHSSASKQGKNVTTFQ